MAKKTFSSRFEFKKWLKRVANVTVLAVTLISQTGSVVTNISSPLALRNATSACKNDLPKGQYIVSYENIEDAEETEIENQQIMYAIGVSAINKSTGDDIGNKEELKGILADQEYFLINKQQEAMNILSVAIVMPSSPAALEELINSLKEHGITNVVPDGTDSINLNNITI